MNVWNMDCTNLFNFIIFQFDGIFCSYISQFGPSHRHAPSPRTWYCASIDGSNQFFIEVFAKARCFYIQFHYNSEGVPRSIVQISNIAFNGDEFWSLHGFMVCDHWQIHIKWVIDYNNDSIEHLAFLLNEEKMQAHQGAVFSKTSAVFLVTQVAFTHVLQLVKAKCTSKVLT